MPGSAGDVRTVRAGGGLRGVILDLDGTVYRGGQLIPGAREAIAELRRWGYALVFTTNALENPAWYAARLARLGIPASPDEVITAPLVLMRYLDRHMPGANVFAIGDPPLLAALRRGFRLSDDPEKIDAVVVSCDQTFDAYKLNIGFQALRQGARFLAVNADATCPTPGGELPDAGAIIGALEGCSKRKVEMIAGKPSALMMETILERLGCPASECLLVGDGLETDILMGHSAGTITALVLSGVTSPADLTHAPVQPDYVVDSIVEVPRLLGKT